MNSSTFAESFMRNIIFNRTADSGNEVLQVDTSSIKATK
jgi:hypothetical protein